MFQKTLQERSVPKLCSGALSKQSWGSEKFPKVVRGLVSVNVSASWEWSKLWFCPPSWETAPLSGGGVESDLWGMQVETQDPWALTLSLPFTYVPRGWSPCCLLALTWELWSLQPWNVHFASSYNSYCHSPKPRKITLGSQWLLGRGSVKALNSCDGCQGACSGSFLERKGNGVPERRALGRGPCPQHWGWHRSGWA